MTIGAIYKERWEIEIFFKTLRQTLTDVVQSAVQENPANIVIDYIDMIYPS